MENIIIREAFVDDIPTIQIVRHTVRENKLSDPKLVTDEDCKDYITNRGKGWVAVNSSQEIIGFAIVDLVENSVWALFLRPDYEQKGIGSQLHRTMMHWYFSQTQKKVWLCTDKNTRAEQFYLRKGWQPIGDYGKTEVKMELHYSTWSASENKKQMESVSNIRKEYNKKQLLETEVAASPFQQFEDWFGYAQQQNVDEVNAMTLATCSTEGVPSARIVLLKGFSEKGFVFYTNYNSQKGKELLENPRASLLFFWSSLERQIRITGLVQKVSKDDSDTYFKSRPLGSQIGAITSPQSQVIESREWLAQKEKEIAETATQENIQRPTHWGGYIVTPVTIEFWQGRPSRLHDRILYSLQENGSWKIERLAP
jgi:pyridoxamine 5'-phosphate oxidase